MFEYVAIDAFFLQFLGQKKTALRIVSKSVCKTMCRPDRQLVTCGAYTPATRRASTWKYKKINILDTKHYMEVHTNH